MLWLCFATKLSLHLDAAPAADDKGSSLHASNNNNNNNNDDDNVREISRNNLSGSKSATTQERRLQRNWINSNLLSETSQLTTVEEMRQKLSQARKELKSINKELRESYANYDYLEVRRPSLLLILKPLDSSSSSHFPHLTRLLTRLLSPSFSLPLALSGRSRMTGCGSRSDSFRAIVTLN